MLTALLGLALMQQASETHFLDEGAITPSPGYVTSFSEEVSSTHSTGAQFFERTINGKRIRGVSIDLTQEHFAVSVVMSKGGVGSRESFASMVNRSKPVAAINGAYFDTQTNRPIGDIVMEGRTLHAGRMGTAFGIRNDGTLFMERVVRHRGVDWSDFRVVLACGPALVLNGRKDVDASGEGFQSASIMGSTSRMGLAFNSDGTLFLIQVRDGVTFDGFADLMLALGATHAMNLDAGASSALFVEGRGFVQQAGRELASALVITKK